MERACLLRAGAQVPTVSHTDTLAAHTACFHEKKCKGEGISFMQGGIPFCCALKWFIAVAAGRVLWQAADYPKFVIPL